MGIVPRNRATTTPFRPGRDREWYRTPNQRSGRSTGTSHTFAEEMIRTHPTESYRVSARQSASRHYDLHPAPPVEPEPVAIDQIDGGDLQPDLDTVPMPDILPDVATSPLTVTLAL